MAINYEIIFATICGGCIGIFFHWLVVKLKKCEDLVNDFINNFPSPKELAKEILKIKMPISELPDDVKNKVQEMMGVPGADEQVPPGDIKKIPDKPSYMG